MFVFSRCGIGYLSVYAWLACSASAFATPILLNGGLSSRVNITVPPDWDLAHSPTVTANADGPYNNTGFPWVLQSGTFVRITGAGTADNGAFEDENGAIQQTVPGFEIGALYTIHFYITNLGFYQAVPTTAWHNHDGYFAFFVDDSPVGQTSAIAGPGSYDAPNQWFLQQFDFTATSTTHTLRFQAFTTAPNPTDPFGSGFGYMGIDTIWLTPEPATGALIGLAAVVFAARRR